MKVTVKDIISLSKGLPEGCLEEAYEALMGIMEKAEVDAEAESKRESCPHCGSKNIVRNGRKRNKQAYLCRGCGKSFLQTATSAIAYSHSGETVWREVIRDTVCGVAIDKTAEALDLSHSTVFNMRHKILSCVEQEIIDSPVLLEGVCEADETYVLESVKGRKIPENYRRKPRRHGAKASKPGISNEYICVCAGVTGEGKRVATAVNRATPSKAELLEVFGDKITDDTVILCDGNSNYDALKDRCTVAHTERINKANGFHSFIKERIRAARGVATIYLNRYNALFAEAFGNKELALDKIFGLMKARNFSFRSIADVKTRCLLDV